MTSLPNLSTSSQMTMQFIHNLFKLQTSFDDVIVISMLLPYHHFNVWQQFKKWKVLRFF